jgi:hypothetical protein
MIFETHADVTRLGYFRLIPILSMLLNENKVIRQDLLARRLLECCLRAGGTSEKPKPTGIITGLTNARNYVAVAQKIQIIDQRTREPGLFGKLYLSLESSKNFEEFAKGEVRLSLEDILNLSGPERLFFLWVISIADFPFIQAIIKWVLQQKEFKRGEAINAIMEEIYPAVLEKVIDAEEASERKSIKRRIAESKNWREKRLTIDKYEWIKTKQYYVYHHIAVPRIEFLIDLGILKKIGRGKYCVREKVLRNSNIILEMCEKEKNEIEEYIFNEIEMFKVIVDEVPREASKYEIMKEMVRAYSRLNQFRIPRLDLLEKVTALLLLENGKYAKLNEIHETFNRLFLQFPGKIYIASDGNNGINVTQMELDDI